MQQSMELRAAVLELAVASREGTDDLLGSIRLSEAFFLDPRNQSGYSDSPEHLQRLNRSLAMLKSLHSKRILLGTLREMLWCVYDYLEATEAGSASGSKPIEPKAAVEKPGNPKSSDPVTAGKTAA